MGIMQIKMMSVSELKTHPENSKYFKPMDSALWQIFIEDIRAFGIREPLTVTNKTNYVVKGNERLRAAIQLEIEEVPVIIQDYEEYEDEIDDLIRDNVLRKDVDIFDKFELVKRLKSRIPGRKRGPKTEDITPVLGDTEEPHLPPTEIIAKSLNETHDMVVLANIFNTLEPEVQEEVKAWFYSQDKQPTKKELTKEIKARKKAEEQVEDLWKELESRDSQISELSEKLVSGGDKKQIDEETKEMQDKLESLRKDRDSIVDEISSLRILSACLIRSREFFSSELLQLPALLSTAKSSSKELIKPEAQSFLVLLDEWKAKFEEVFGL